MYIQIQIIQYVVKCTVACFVAIKFWLDTCALLLAELVQLDVHIFNIQ